MLVKNDGRRGRLHEKAPWVLPLVLVALALAWERWAGGAAGREGRGSGELHRFLRPAETTSEPPGRSEGELVALGLDIPPSSAAVLQEARDRALERGVILQRPEDTVPATVLFEGARLPAQVRIKGDWIDHVSTDQWSLRVKLEEPSVLGMREFSIQAPSTVGFAWEWVVHELMRREGVLAPRSTFVDVVINGHPAGAYFLQEHFGRELLEAQGRREGPIVIWDESTHWAALLQHDLELPGPPPVRPALRIDTAPVRAYGERRLASIESLRRSLFGAVEKMRALRNYAIADRGPGERLRALRALDELQGESLERLVEMDRLTCAHAVASLFQLEHSLYWHNMRFYHDPVLDRLEPIMFDNMAHQPGGRDPVPLRGEGFATQFSKSHAYVNGVFRHLGRLVRPGYLEERLAELAPDLARFRRALPEGMEEGIESRLIAQRDYLRAIVLPADPLNLACFYELEELGEPGESAEPAATGGLAGTFEVSAWATTRAPVVLEGFRFRNGRFVPARTGLVEPDWPESMCAGGGVVLPHDGEPARFRLPFDERLANLASVQELKRAIRAAARAPGALDLEVDAVFRPLASDEPRRERLLMRHFDPGWAAEAGRPSLPSVAQALASHPFLTHDPVTDELGVEPGVWDVAGDLLVPAGRTLVIAGEVTLGFEPGAVLLSEGPLRFRGVPGSPIVLAPRPGAQRWSGIVVLAAQGRSELAHVTIRDTDAVARGSWNVTGGVTFYRSPVTLSDCRFEGSAAEDALNVFATDVRMERVAFERCASDAFDGDFVSGTIRDCVFRDGQADGVDLAGSEVEIAGCTFRDLGDKAVSAGEASRVRIEGGRMEGVSVGVAAKDRSQVVVRGASIRARNWALAAYVKKPAFGPARLEANEVRVEPSSRGVALAQTGCSVSVNGEPVPTRDVDVERLYREGILGR